MRDPAFWADIVAAIHVAFVLFLFGGFALLVASDLQLFPIPHRRYFRGAHLSAVLFTLLRTWLNLPCPLRPLENWLRPGQESTSSQITPFAEISHRLFFRNADHTPFTFGVTVFSA